MSSLMQILVRLVPDEYKYHVQIDCASVIRHVLQKLWLRFCMLPDFPTTQLSVVQSRFQAMSVPLVLWKTNVQLNIYSSLGMSAMCI